MTVHLLDVNILLAILDSAHVHHTLCTRWFLRSGCRAWAICPLTENGFLRIVTSPAYPNFRPAPSVASELLRGLQASFGETFTFFPDDVRLSDSSLFDLRQVKSSKQLTDVYLAGLAHNNGARLATLDAGIQWQAVRGASHSLIHLLQKL